MAAGLKDNQDKLLSYGRGLETLIEEHAAELLREKAGLESCVALRTAELHAANAALKTQAAELSMRNQEITLLGRMSDFLQAATAETEAYAIIADTLGQLFPDDSGAVFVLAASRDMLEAAAQWGAAAPARAPFAPNECWAHRLGKVHLAIGSEQRCPHVGADIRSCVCLPLTAQGETLGVLHVADGGVGDERDAALRMAEKSRLAKILGDNIGLGIANLKLRESMRSLSIRDQLTGLFNRRYMEEILAQELHRARRNATQVAVVMIDIDHFKRFNDEFGHDGGDAVLRALGEYLGAHVRASDTVCRFGGEEFILILSPSTAAGAPQRAETIREGAQRLRVQHAGRGLGVITLSLGVAIYPDQAADAVALVKAADVALYRAKRSGRNRVVVFEEAGPLQAASGRS